MRNTRQSNRCCLCVSVCSCFIVLSISGSSSYAASMCVQLELMKIFALKNPLRVLTSVSLFDSERDILCPCGVLEHTLREDKHLASLGQRESLDPGLFTTAGAACNSGI